MRKITACLCIIVITDLGTSPQTYTNVDFSETVTVTVEGMALLSLDPVPPMDRVTKTGNHVTCKNVICLHTYALLLQCFLQWEDCK